MIVVGDLLHAGNNKEVEALRDLTETFSETRFILIKGNHDRQPTTYFKALGFHTEIENFQHKGLRFAHHPIHDNIPTISGHIHPGVRIRLPHKKYLRFPCYAILEKQLILPAFSWFTGLDSSTLPRSTTYYAIHEQGLFKVTTP